MITAGSLFSELAHALRRSISDSPTSQTAASSSKSPLHNSKKTKYKSARESIQEEDEEQEEQPELGAQQLSKDLASGLTDTVVQKMKSRQTVSRKSSGLLQSDKSDPDIHPELTLQQLQNPQPHSSYRFRRTSKKKHFPISGDTGAEDHCANESCDCEDRLLEINTMFDFYTRSSRPRGRVGPSPSRGGRGGGGRRSSVAVMAGGANMQQCEQQKRSRKYFASHHLHLDSSRQLQTPQSRSAVHYLAISPPRIRITDAQGCVSPDMYGRRHGQEQQHIAKTHSNVDLSSNKSGEQHEPSSSLVATASSDVSCNSLSHGDRDESDSRRESLCSANIQSDDDNEEDEDEEEEEEEEEEDNAAVTRCKMADGTIQPLSTTASTSSSSVCLSRGNTESRRSSADTCFSRSARSSVSSVSCDASARSSFDVVDSRRSSEEFAPSHFLNTKEQIPVMSPISENSSFVCSNNGCEDVASSSSGTMQERRASLTLPFNSKTEMMALSRGSKHVRNVGLTGGQHSPTFRKQSSPNRLASNGAATAAAAAGRGGGRQGLNKHLWIKKRQADGGSSSVSFDYTEPCDQG